MRTLDHSRFGKNPAYTEIPVLFYHDNKVSIQYARRLFTGFLGLPRSPGIPNLTEAQAEALDTLHFLGEKYNLALNFQKGRHPVHQQSKRLPRSRCVH